MSCCEEREFSVCVMGNLAKCNGSCELMSFFFSFFLGLSCIVRSFRGRQSRMDSKFRGRARAAGYTVFSQKEGNKHCTCSKASVPSKPYCWCYMSTLCALFERKEEISYNKYNFRLRTTFYTYTLLINTFTKVDISGKYKSFTSTCV